MRVDRAFVINLMRAAAGRHRRYIFLTDFFGKIHKFRRGNVESVAVGVEIAAVAAGIAGILDFRFWILDLLVEPAIEIGNGIYYSSIF